LEAIGEKKALGLSSGNLTHMGTVTQYKLLLLLLFLFSTNTSLSKPVSSRFRLATAG